MPVITTPRRASSARLTTLIAQAMAIGERFGRSDLTDRLAVARTRLVARPLDVAVIRAPVGDAGPTIQTLRTAAAGARSNARFREITGTSWSPPAGGHPDAAPDVVLIVTDATHEFGPDEFLALQGIRAAAIPVAALQTEFDNSPGWQQVQQDNRRRLAAAGLDDPPMALLPISVALCRAGLDQRDGSRLIASGVPQLFEFLTERLDTAVEVTVSQFVMEVLREVVADLEHAADRRTRQAAAAPTPAVRHEVAVAELERRQLLSTKWQLMLADGMADLVAEVDFDLRDRLRDALAEAEVVIGGNRPPGRWTDFETTVRATVDEYVAQTYRFAEQRSTALTHRIALTLTGQPPDAQPGIPSPAVEFVEPTEALRGLAAMERPSRGAVSARLVNSLRGCYGGILMVGVLTSLAGMKLISTWSVAAGILLGAFTFGEDRRAGTDRGRAEARIAVSRYLDAVNFRVGEDLRTRLRLAHRTIRDHYTSLNDQRLHAAAEAVHTTRSATSEPTAQAGASRDAAAVAELRAGLDALPAPTPEEMVRNRAGA
jgi:hypothetical protein